MHLLNVNFSEENRAMDDLQKDNYYLVYKKSIIYMMT